ncbi:hypothetical protein EJ04DRAFT_109157 [Polyplosphaeria fusca]|uniref:F-box domain-containing protein n=1 Tax=Polyplosphaeria fusca TaxID=682080 RepID=A0A9P4UWS3_9PLEO|nr:hypothetical protein EJ04DRAFT_109157 [Polyplosphaeria fusca]
MAIIYDCPNEILHMICAYLDDYPERIQLITSLCLVSKRVRAVALPFLYKTFVSRRRGNNFRLLKFVYALINRSDIAEHVRNVDIELPSRVGSLSINHMPTSTTEFWEEAKEIVRQAANKFQMPRGIKIQWRNHFDYDHENACTAILLVQTSPNLQELHLRYDQGVIAILPWSLELMRIFSQSRSALGHDAFPALHTVRLSCRLHKTRGAIRFRQLTHLFQLPNIRHIEVNGCLEMSLGNGSLWDHCWQGVQSATLETLIFRESMLHANALYVVLRSCKALKNFHLEMDLLGPAWNKFDYGRLNQGLAYHVDSLRTLCIGFHDKAIQQNQGHGTMSDSKLLSLTNFAKLRSLTIPLNMIVQFPPGPEAKGLAELLPDSLQGLEICNTILLRQYFGVLLQYLLKSRITSMTQLRTLQIRSLNPLEPNWLIVAGMLQERGVSLVLE